MTNWTTLPHQNLIAYQVARELVVIIREARIADAKLRDQALRAATSACLNIAEAVGRVTEPDKARVYGIARGEGCEAVAAMDVAAAGGWCAEQSAQAALAAGLRLYAVAHSIEPPLADKPAEQGIDPAGAGCPCVRSVGSAPARDGSDIECRRGLTNLTAGDRIDPLLIRAPRPAGSLRTSDSNLRAAWYAMSFSCGRVVQFSIVVLL